MVMVHNVQYKKILTFGGLICVFFIMTRYYLTQDEIMPDPRLNEVELIQETALEADKLSALEEVSGEKTNLEKDNWNPEIKDLSLEVSNKLNSEPPSQAWVFNQLRKTMSWLDWKYSPPNDWERCSLRTYYFHKIKTIFTGVPKTGCSTWLMALLHAEGEMMGETDPERADTLSHGTVFANHRIKGMIEAHGRPVVNGAYSFAVVRNPWTRLVSGYRDLFYGEKKNDQYRAIGIHIVREMRGITDPKRLQDLHPTFADYAKWLVKKGSHHHDRYFYPQVIDLCIPHAMYDFIIPLEHSEVLSKKVLSAINLHGTYLLGSYDKSSDPRYQKSTLHAKEWLSLLDSDVTDRLYSFYKADFMLMNYSNFTHPDFPLPLHGN